MDTKATNYSWISVIARIGFVAKGAVYFMVGLLATQVAFGMKGEATGTQQALREFITPTFGSILLIGCAAGLFAHAIWRILQSIVDPENREDSLNTAILRIVDFFTGGLYLSLSYAAIQIFRGLSTESSGENTEVWVSKILDLPYGKWIILFFALVIVIAGLYQFYLAYTASFEYRFDSQRMNSKEQKTLRQLGRIGFVAWGIVYLMMGFLFYNAAISYDPNQAGGLADALNALRDQPYGIWILGITSGGLLIYGIYLLVLSYYHKAITAS